MLRDQGKRIVSRSPQKILKDRGCFLWHREHFITTVVTKRMVWGSNTNYYADLKRDIVQ